MRKRLLALAALLGCAGALCAATQWVDISNVLKNADLSAASNNKVTGWTILGSGGSQAQNVSTDGNNTHAQEFYSQWAGNTNRLGSDISFGIKQDVTLPAGTYTLGAYALFRSGGSTSSASLKVLNGTTELQTTTISYAASVTLEGTGNDLQKAANTFHGTNNHYTAQFTLTEAATVTLQIDGTHTCYCDWFVVGPVTLSVQKDIPTTAESGTDLTSLILNPSFETGNTAGWVLTATSTDTGVRENSNNTYKTTGVDGSYLFNTWSQGVPLKQTLGVLPEGKYELKALLATGDSESDPGVVFLTVNDAHSTGMQSEGGDKTKFHEHSMKFRSDGQTPTTIGVVGAGQDKQFSATGYWWYKADNFRLTCLGNVSSWDLFEAARDAAVTPWTTGDDYATNWTTYQAYTEQTPDDDLDAATAYLKANSDLYAWDHASLAHPYDMTVLIKNADCADNTAWTGSGRTTDVNINDHWSGTQRTVFTQNCAGTGVRHQNITIEKPGTYLLQTAVRPCVNGAWAKIHFGDKIGLTDTYLGFTGGNVNKDFTKGTDDLANNGQGFGWQMNEVTQYVKTANTAYTINIELSYESGNHREKCQAGGMRLLYIGQSYDETTGGIHRYYGPQTLTTAELTDDVPVLDFTEATLQAPLTLTATNPNGIVYAAADANITGGNVVKGGTCAQLTLTDGHPVQIPAAFTATDATYTMTAVADGRFGTLLLPYDATLPAGGKAYSLDADIDLTGDIYGTELQTLTANEPALVTMAGQYTAHSAAIAATPYTSYNKGHLTGVYAATEAPEGSYVLQNHATAGVAFYLVGQTKPTVGALRAFIPAQGNGVKAIRVLFPDATAIDDAPAATTSAPVYDLAGRRVQRPAHGLYIINGKKIIK